jgi:uncharacterized membrane protein
VLTFESLWALTLLAVLPPILWFSRRSKTNLGRRHMVVATALRTLTVVLVLLTLMQPVWNASTRAISVVYALDVSRSVAPDFVESALEWIRNANREYAPASARYVVFAQRPILLNDLEEVPRVAVTTASGAGGSALQQDATNLELALDEALLGFDAERIDRLVLMSDGNATQGDLWRALPRLRAQRVRVYPFPARPRAPHDAWIESVEVPSDTRRDEPVAVTVRVMSMATARAMVRLREAGGELGQRSVRLASGMNEIAFRTRLRHGGAVDLVAEVKAEGDTMPENDRLTLTALVEPRARVLYAEGNSDGESYLQDALTREGIDVVLASAANLPQHASALSDYQAVLLSDVPRNALDDKQMSALENYVRDGGGLIYIGGETAYGQSGYAGTALERLLPVEFKAQEQRKDLALVVCLDRSYSMKGRSMELAKAATRAALAILEEQHQFGVIAFDSRPHETVPLQPVRNRHHAEDLIDRIQAGGQTNIYAALATALQWLEGVESPSRHVILLSDGDTAPADFERLLRRMAAARITVSTVAVGPAADRELMSAIARWGKGHAYYADNPDAVPQIFVEDTLNASRSTLVEEPVRAVVKRPIEALRGIDFARAPMLRGFARTKSRDDAEVLLESASGAPLLVRWQYGLGRAVVFASDARNRWAADWLQWDGYGKFWGQITRDVLRRDTGESLRFKVTREGGDAHIRLDAMSGDGNWRNRLAPVVRVRLPTGTEQTFPLHQTSPGAYMGTVALGNPGSQPFSFGLVPGGGVTSEAARRTGLRRLYYSFPDEYRSSPPNVELLRALAEATGGKLAPETAHIFDPGSDRGRTRQALWPLFAAAALVAYLLDIAVRRAPWLRRWFEPV